MIDEKKVIYGDLNTRLMANCIDSLIAVVCLSWIVDLLFYMAYPEGSVYTALRQQVMHENPDIGADLYKFGYVLQLKYPQLIPIIFQQFLFQLFLTFCVLGAYFVYFTHKYGGSPGKLVMGLRVRDHITGGKISLTQNFIRFLAYIPSAGFLGIGLLSGALRKNKRCWHDFLADSEVVYAEDRWYKGLFARLRKYFNI